MAADITTARFLLEGNRATVADMTFVCEPDGTVSSHLVRAHTILDATDELLNRIDGLSGLVTFLLDLVDRLRELAELLAGVPPQAAVIRTAEQGAVRIAERAPPVPLVRSLTVAPMAPPGAAVPDVRARAEAA